MEGSDAAPGPAPPDGPDGTREPGGIGRALGVRRALVPVALAAAIWACGNGSPADGRAGAREAPDRAASGQAAAEAGTTPDTSAAPGDAGPRLTTIEVGGHRVEVEVADDEDERSRGLMDRDSLPEDQGMLFVYPEQKTLSFWMRNTRIPLDIAYIDERGYIVDVQRMEPHTEDLHPSSRPAMYALEMNRGWFEAHGVGEGDRVRF